MSNSPRRAFLGSALAGSALGLSETGFLQQLAPVSAQDARLDPKLVKLSTDLEPLVRLLEDTPREQLLEEVATRVKRGTSYRELIAALLLAGVRNVQPRPSVGFKFHAVLVVNSAHLASLSSPPEHRWLPIFWSLDTFKSSQAQTQRESGWRMTAIDESKVPTAARVQQLFQAAMDRWEEPAADAAVCGLARALNSQQAFEVFARYGMRDFRSIGHKAIYVANAWRTLQFIGWHNAEPVLRSLAYALLAHEGSNPLNGDAPADRPWRRNVELVKKIRADWRDGKVSAAATQELLDTLRTGDDADASAKVIELLNRGTAPQSIWDALFSASGEWLARQPGIVALHACTTTNAMRYTFDATKDDETRRLLLLQNAAFVTMFREAMKSRGAVADRRLEAFEPAPLKEHGAGAVDEIFAEVSRDKAMAARKTLAYLKAHPNPKELIDAARLLVFFKGTDSHDYKFSSAALEDYAHLSPRYRDHWLAASMFQLRGAGAQDNKLVQRIRAALG